VTMIKKLRGLSKKLSKQLNLNELECSKSDIPKKESKNLKQLNESSGGESNDSDVPDSRAMILAFRMITTMLSYIKSPTEVTTRPNISDSQRYELRVLDALSAVIIRRYEVAAVMAKRYNGDKKIEVLVSVNDTSISEPVLTISQQSHHCENIPGSFIITPKPRDPDRNPKDKIDSLTTRNTTPTILTSNIGISEALTTANRGNLL
jgi:hypothetical protein